MLKNSIVLFTLVFFQLSCSKPKEQPYELPANAKTVLSGDSSKTWKLARRFNNKTRMNMGDCFLSYKATYYSDMRMHDNSGEHKDCGETLTATWKFAKDENGNYYIRIESKQLPDLMNIEEAYKLFKVLRLTDEQMTLQFNHKQFSSKSTTITDIYVPVHVVVADREFHW